MFGSVIGTYNSVSILIRLFQGSKSLKQLKDGNVDVLFLKGVFYSFSSTRPGLPTKEHTSLFVCLDPVSASAAFQS